MTTDAQHNTDTAPAAPGSEEAALLELHARDPQSFEYAPWRDSGRTGAERLLDLRRDAQGNEPEGNPAEHEHDGEQAGDDDLADADDLDAAPGEGGEVEASTSDEAVGVNDYTAPAIEGVTWNDDALKPIIEVAARHGVAADAMDEALSAYGELIQQQRAKLAAGDKAALSASIETLGGKEAYAPIIESAKATMRSWPAELRDAVRDARTSDGRRLALLPSFVRALANMGGNRQANHIPQDSKAMLQQELNEIDALMARDIDEYHRPWRHTGISASDRKMAILRELGDEAPAKPSAADLRAEERELVALRNRDPQMFAFGDWRGTGRPASDRLVAIQTGRA